MDVNKEEIISVLKELNKITGFRISLHGTDYSEIAAYPPDNLCFCKHVQDECGEKSECLACDKSALESAAARCDTVIYTCRNGLVEAVSPLYDYGTLTGYLMMGQVLAMPQGDCSDFERVIGELTKKYGGFVEKIPRVPSDIISSYVHIMTICARYLTLSNAVPESTLTLAEQARDYIHENISSRVTIATICGALKCSKTSLLTAFKKKYGITVNSYITEKRLEIAAKMLVGTKTSIGQIAAESGFSDQSYFSKVFSSKFGIPPSEYGKGLK